MGGSTQSLDSLLPQNCDDGFFGKSCHDEVRRIDRLKNLIVNGVNKNPFMPETHSGEQLGLAFGSEVFEWILES